MYSWLWIFSSLLGFISPVIAAPGTEEYNSVKTIIRSRIRSKVRNSRSNSRLKITSKIKSKKIPEQWRWGQFFAFFSGASPGGPNTHMVSKSNQTRKLDLESFKRSGEYVPVSADCKVGRSNLIPADVWVDHKTGRVISKDDIPRIKMVPIHKETHKDILRDEIIKIGYLKTFPKENKKHDIKSELYDGIVTLSQLSKMLKLSNSAKKPQKITINGWAFSAQETPKVVYAAGTKDNKTITVVQWKKIVPYGVAQLSLKDILCIALQQKDAGLKVYTFSQVVKGKEMAELALIQALSKALKRPVSSKEIVWKYDPGSENEEAVFFEDSRKDLLQSRPGHVKRVSKAMKAMSLQEGEEEPVFGAYMQNNARPISFDVGALIKSPIGCLRFGISRKKNLNDLPDPTGSYYVYVDYGFLENEDQPMDDDFALWVWKKLRNYRLKVIHALPENQQGLINKIENQYENQRLIYTDIKFMPGTECIYDPSWCDNRSNSSPVNHTGVHFKMSPDEHTRILENGEFYACGKDQSGIKWMEEINRMSKGIEEDRWLKKGVRPKEAYINGWTIQWCIGEKGIYGFAHDAGRTISFGQIKKDNTPIAIADVFYKAWKIFDKNFADFHVRLNLKNDATEQEVLSHLNVELLIRTGKELDHAHLEHKDVVGIPFKVGTLVLEFNNKIKGMIKYGFSDQSKRQGSTPIGIVVGRVCDSEAGRKGSAEIMDGMRGYLEKDLGRDFACLVKNQQSHNASDLFSVIHPDAATNTVNNDGEVVHYAELTEPWYLADTSQD